MRKILSMAALALIMASCSNDEENVVIDNGEATNGVAIQISQKVAGVETKGAVTPGNTMQAVIVMVDAGSSTDAPDFSAFKPNTKNDLTGAGNDQLESESARANVATAEFKAGATAGSIGLNPTLYYPITTGKKTWAFGVSPQGVVDASNITFTDVDGLQDVMYAAKQAAGSGNSVESSIELNFIHKLTQLTFVSKLTSANLTGTEWEGKTVSVQSIVIQNAKLPKTLAFSTGDITRWETKSLTVAGCKETLTANECDLSVPVMISPASELIVNLTLKVGNDLKTYNNLTVKNSSNQNLGTESGKSHKVTFDITAPKAAEGQTSIAVTAKVTDWVPGDAGKVEIK